MKVFINFVRDTVEVRIGKSVLILDQFVKPETNLSMDCPIPKEFLTRIGQFIEDHAYSDRLILKHKMFLSTPRKVYIRSDFLGQIHISFLKSFCGLLSLTAKIYNSEEISFEELCDLRTYDCTEFIFKYELEENRKNYVGDRAVFQRKKETVFMCFGLLILTIFEYNLQSSIFFSLILFSICSAFWIRLRMKLGAYFMFFIYPLALFLLFATSLLIPINLSNSKELIRLELTILESVSSFLIFFVMYFFMINNILTILETTNGQKNKLRRATTNNIRD